MPRDDDLGKAPVQGQPQRLADRNDGSGVGDSAGMVGPRAGSVLPPNVGPASLVRVLDSGERLLGNGFRVDPKHVLTARSVVRRADDTLAVADPRGSFVPRAATVAWPGTTPDDSSGVVVLETGPCTDFIRSTVCFEGPLTAGAAWWAVGYGNDAVAPEDRGSLRGTIGSEVEGRWGLELDEFVESSHLLDAWRGAAVFVSSTEQVPWRLAGVLDVGPTDAGWPLVLCPLDALFGWPAFDDILGLDTRVADTARYVDVVATSLTRPDICNAIFERDDEGTFGDVADPRSMAEAVCTAIEPVPLADALGRTHHRLLKQGQPEAAEAVFSALMTALPAAIQRYWSRELPEHSAQQMVLAVAHRAMVELVLAAADGLEAVFNLPAPGRDDIPASPFQVGGPAELGPDPDGAARAAQLAVEIEKLLVIEGASREALPEARRVIAALFACRHGTEGLLVDHGDLEAAAIEGEADPQRTSRALFDGVRTQLVQGIGEGGRFGKGRFVYYLAEIGKDDEMAEILQKYLPEVRIVTRRAPEGHSASVQPLIKALKNVFHRRLANSEGTP